MLINSNRSFLRFRRIIPKFSTISLHQVVWSIVTEHWGLQSHQLQQFLRVWQCIALRRKIIGPVAGWLWGANLLMYLRSSLKGFPRQTHLIVCVRRTWTRANEFIVNCLLNNYYFWIKPILNSGFIDVFSKYSSSNTLLCLLRQLYFLHSWKYIVLALIFTMKHIPANKSWTRSDLKITKSGLVLQAFRH